MNIHQRADVADRPDVDLAAGQECHRPAEIDREAALDAAENHALDPLVLSVDLFEPGPGFFAPRLVARQDRFAQRILDALEIDLDRRRRH